MNVSMTNCLFMEPSLHTTEIDWFLLLPNKAVMLLVSTRYILLVVSISWYFQSILTIDRVSPQGCAYGNRNNNRLAVFGVMTHR